MQTVGTYSLNNQCAAVVKIQFHCADESGRTALYAAPDGVPSHVEVIDPGVYGVRAGATITLAVQAAAGTSLLAGESFIYQPDDRACACYTTHGAALTLGGVRNGR